MVTRDAVLTIFNECDTDNDGIVWLSELKQLALTYTSHQEDDIESDQDEDIPLNFEDFLERFAPQLQDFIPACEVEAGSVEEDVPEENIDVDGVNVNETDTLGYKKLLSPKSSGTSSGVSDCSMDPSPEPLNYPFSPEVGFEGYGEASDEEEEGGLLSDKAVPSLSEVPSEATNLSPTDSFRRKNSPFRLSQRRLKRSSAPTTSLTGEQEAEKEGELRQTIEELTSKVYELEHDITNERNTVNKITGEKRELHEKVLHLEEVYRDLDISSRKSERDRNEALQEMTDKYNSLKKTSESDRLVLTQQIKKFEDEMKHSLKVKETMAEEVVRLREVWADSQEQEAMWETKYNEILAITSQKDEEMEVLESSQEKERQSSANAIKHLEEEIRILNDDIEEMTARKRSDTVIGRLQGKVERIQEENAQLKEMTETMLSRDPNAAQASVLAFEIDSVSQEEIVDAYSTMQRDYAHLQKYVDKLLMNIIAEAPHLLCVDTSAP